VGYELWEEGFPRWKAFGKGLLRIFENFILKNDVLLHYVTVLN